jgi:hypothetical protein
MKNESSNNTGACFSNGVIRGQIKILTHTHGRLIALLVSKRKLAEKLGEKFNEFMTLAQTDGARVHYYARYRALAVINKREFSRFTLAK